MTDINKDRFPPQVESARECNELDRLADRCRRVLKRNEPVTGALAPEQLERLHRRYSNFEDRFDERGFLVESTHLVTKLSTPKPYIHLISSNHPHEKGIYGSFWDQCGAGFSCLDSALAGPITSHQDPSYVPTAPRAADHRHFYLSEESAEAGYGVWHMLPQRKREENEYDNFCCEQGLGYVRINSSRNGIDSQLLVFVPVEDPLEVWRVKLSNTTERERKISLFTAVNWGLDSYPGYYFDPRVVNVGRPAPELNALLAFNNDKNNKHPRSGFLAASESYDGFDMSGEDFTGGGHFSIFPVAVAEGRCKNSLGMQPYQGLIAAMQFDITLSPGEEKEILFLLGAGPPEEELALKRIAAFREKYFGSGSIEGTFSLLRRSWEEMVGRHMVKTPDEEIDRFYNVWSKYQAKNMARFVHALDKVGYRDVLQHLSGINTFDPGYVASHLPTVLRFQLHDGRAVRQFSRFENAPHDTRMYMDSSSWIADTLVEYIKETGDKEILERREGFYDPDADRIDRSDTATLYDHALRGIKALFHHRASNGHCKIGHGDWNDALDEVGGEDGEGVSVWLSMALVYAARKLRELAVYMGDGKTVEFLDQIIEEMTDVINTNAWDGDHYIYAFMPDGTPVGANSCEEGKIHMNVNTWSLFNGVAEAGGRVKKVLEAISRLDTPIGHLMLAPPYTQKSRSLGRIADIAPGMFDNGSIYTHSQSFLIYGLVCLGRGDEAYAEMKKRLPRATIPDISTGPLHQVSNYAVGPYHEHFGREHYHNFTGSVAWYRKSLDRMFGLLADFDALVVAPCIPSAWKSYEVIKVFRGCRVHAQVENPNGVNQGVVKAILDGCRLPVADGRANIPTGMLAGRDKAELIVEMGKV